MREGEREREKWEGRARARQTKTRTMIIMTAVRMVDTNETTVGDRKGRYIESIVMMGQSDGKQRVPREIRLNTQCRCAGRCNKTGQSTVCSALNTLSFRPFVSSV